MNDLLCHWLANDTLWEDNQKKRNIKSKNNSWELKQEVKSSTNKKSRGIYHSSNNPLPLALS